VAASNSGGNLHMLTVALLWSEDKGCASLCICIGGGSAANVDRCDMKLVTKGGLFLLGSDYMLCSSTNSQISKLVFPAIASKTQCSSLQN